MKKIIALVLVLMLAVSVSAFAEKIGISMPTQDIQRWIQDGEHMQNMFEEAGYEVNLQYAASEVNTQVNQVQTMAQD